MPRVTAPRPTREHVLAAFRRRELLAAARGVFGQRGFDCATMEAIAARAGVAKGTVYLYFPSKQAVYDATVAEGLDELERLTQAAIDVAPGLKDAIQAFVSVRVRYFQERPDFFKMYVAEISHQLTHARRRTRACSAALDGQTQGLQRVLACAIARGEVRDVDPAAAAHVIFDTTRGLVARRLLTCPRSDATRDIEFLTDLIWTGLTRQSTGEGPTP